MDIIALMMNAADRPLPFHLPGDFAWRMLLDAADLGAKLLLVAICARLAQSSATSNTGLMSSSSITAAFP